MSPRPDGLVRRPDGELVPEDIEPTPTSHACDQGWLDHDPPRPCPTCRPETARRLAAQRRRHTPDEHDRASGGWSR